ncbi:MAG: hypothetical protein AABX70_02830 [Nanoarchaeota archaeon]
MKKAVFSLVLVLFLVACVGFKQGPYSFEEGFNYIKGLDERYGGNFKTEQMDVNQVDSKRIDAFQEDLQAFASRVSQDPDSLNKNKLLQFIEARKQMLDSEHSYLLAQGMGNFKDLEVRSCDHKKEMEYAYKYYKSAMEKGADASDLFDHVMQDFEIAQNLIGIHPTGSDIDGRPLFYLSAWDATGKLLDKMAISLNECIAKANQE